MAISKAADYTGISVKVIDLADGALPQSPYNDAVAIGHMDDFEAVLGATRPVKKYTPINDRDYEQIVSTGSIEYTEFNATVLFDFNSQEGVNKLHKAFNDNAEIGIVMELNDAKTKGGKGTMVAQIIKVSEFSIGGEKDGKTKATIKAERIGKPILTQAS